MNRLCGSNALLPESLKISPASYDPIDTPLGHGGFADVWKGWCRGQEVAAKVLKVYETSDFEQIRKVGGPQFVVFIDQLQLPAQRFCKEVVTWKALRHENVLPLVGATMTEDKFVMVSEWMENGSINGFVKTHLEVNRLELVSFSFASLIFPRC